VDTFRERNEEFNSPFSSCALKLDAALCRLSNCFEAMEAFLDVVSVSCGSAWSAAINCNPDDGSDAVARASAWSLISLRMSQQQMAIDLMRITVAAMLDSSCEVSASLAVFGEIVQLQRLQAKGK
jgi:hypothetical protein